MIYIVMGVSGAGKTFIGKKLARVLQIPFYDADDFHPPANIAKMEHGKPLNDQDRQPWLQELAHNIKIWDQTRGAVLACSALKNSYRRILSSTGASNRFIFLKGTKTLINRRMKNRSDHFFPESLLDSQFEALEEPADAIIVNIDQSSRQMIRAILGQLNG